MGKKKECLSMFIICSGKATAFYNTASHKSFQFNGVTVHFISHLSKYVYFILERDFILTSRL